MSLGITIVGLGPGAPEQLTREAWRVLQDAREVYLRTARHPCIPALPATASYHSFDELYETLETFEQVYKQIAQRVLELGSREQGVVYAVPGHPLVGESSVQRILALARERGIPTRIVAGVSFMEAVFTVLGVDPLDGMQICDATLLAQRFHPNLDPDVPALVAQVYNRHLAGEVKATLLNLYPDEHPITLVSGAGTSDERVRPMPLYLLDRQDDLDHLCAVYIPALPAPGSMNTYQDVIARLRSPQGCPWDREQTHASLRKHLLEETYELLDALDADDVVEIREELGDLLLQVLLHTQIATEDGDFRLIDVVQQVVEKLIRRHPHVFGSAAVQDANDILRNWEQIKRKEKNHEAGSMLAGIAKALPALSQAMEMQGRVARVGFDWPDAQGVLQKVREELRELEQASDPEEQAAELGDLLFSLVNLARWYNIDPESALRETNQRFARRFAAMERQAVTQGSTLADLGPAALDALWEQAKRDEQR